SPVARSTAPAPPKSREWPRRQPTLVRARLGRRVTPVNGLRSVGTRPLACHDCSRVRTPVRFSSEFDPQVQVVLPAVDVERPRLPAAASGTEFLDRSPTAMSRSGARFSQAGCSVRKVEPLSHFIPDEAHRMSPAPHALVLRAREALARGDVRSAEAAVDERLKTAGRDINALGVRSFLLQRRGQFGEAARTLQTV